IGIGEGSSFIVKLPPSVSLVNGDEELDAFCARPAMLTVSIVDAANNVTTIAAVRVTPIERNFMIMKLIDYIQYKAFSFS
ncbi:MAG: hypothetical protein WCF07_00210, partial [Nitrososphaeraceae archaeon]